MQTNNHTPVPTCLVCLGQLPGDNPRRRTCSNACRQRRHRIKKLLELVDLKITPANEDRYLELYRTYGLRYMIHMHFANLDLPTEENTL